MTSFLTLAGRERNISGESSVPEEGGAPGGVAGGATEGPAPRGRTRAAERGVIL